MKSQKVNTKTVVFIGGPTASGKTSLAISVAKELDCEIISADSRQFYKEISIGTAKPNKAELSQIKHHFIDSLSIHDAYSVGDFERDAIELISRLHRSKDYVVVVGGTGFFMKALYRGLDYFPRVNQSTIEFYNLLFTEEGISRLQKELESKDPAYASQVDLNNPQRIIRALSIIKETGKPFSSFLNNKAANRNFRSIRVKIEIERNRLYERINNRVDQMIHKGLIDEARSVYKYKELNSLNTVGYKELFQWFDGQHSKTKAIDKIKQHTRNYAKRQITWFNNQDEWLPVNSSEEVLKRITSKEINPI